MPHRAVIAAIGLVCLLATESSGAFLSMDHWAYRDIDALQVRGYRVVSASTLKPYSRRQIAEGVARLAAREAEISPYERQLVDRLMAEFAADLEGDRILNEEAGHADSLHGAAHEWWVRADVNPRLIAQQNPMRLDQPRANRLPAVQGVATDRLRSINTLDLSLRIAPRLTTGQRLEMDTDGIGDNTYRGRLQTYRLGATGEVQQAYVLYETGWGKFSFGRIPLVWGPERQGNLHVSDNAPALDMISAEVSVHWLHFHAFTGQMEIEPLGDGLVAHRFLTGHRLVLTPTRWLELGAAETVVYGGPDQSISFKWSNPLLWMYPEEANVSVAEENLLASVDVTVRPWRRMETYAALLMDDIALDKRSPDRIAWTVGLRWEAPMGWDRAGVGLEYTRLTRWVYNYARNATYLRYTNERALMGHFLGPDGDALFLDSHWESTGGLRITGHATHRRQGETRFTSPFPISQPSANIGYRCDPFPFGIVEATTSGELIVSAPPKWGACLSVAIIGQTVRNTENKRTPRRWEIGFRLDLDWHIPLRM